MENFLVTNENPFKGLNNCLDIFHGNFDEDTLDEAWAEVKDSKEKREMFFAVCFSIGDISNRNHNIFKNKKVDSGGNSMREEFYIFVNWLFKRQPKQFEEFLFAGLFNEYQCFDTLFRSRVKTENKKKTTTNIIEVYDMFNNSDYREMLSDYIVTVINGNNNFNKLLVSKFLTIPRLSKRSGHKKMLAETKKVMQNRAMFLNLLSKKMSWDSKNFKGYRKWRKNFNKNLESVLFSTGKIKDFSDSDLMTWLNSLPAEAHKRVRMRINKDPKKWEVIKKCEDKWMTLKEEKQAEQRVLEEKVRQGEATEEDLKTLEVVKKEAKVNTGAIDFVEIFNQVEDGTIDELRINDFIQNKVNLPFNFLTILDDSGSMRGFPFNFGVFLSTICLYKNPDDKARNLLALFDEDTRWFSVINRKQVDKDQRDYYYDDRTVKIPDEPLIKPELSFMENFRRNLEFFKIYNHGGGTHIDSIPENLYISAQRNSSVLDIIKKYPIWIIISDGEWNSLPFPEDSMKSFMEKCDEYFGFKPFVIAIDVYRKGYNQPRDPYKSIRKFAGIQNTIYIQSNPAQIEQLLVNFKEGDIFDVYTPLLSIYRSNRYEPIKEKVI